MIPTAASGAYRSLVLLVRIATRPLRAETWRELAYLLLGFAASIVVCWGEGYSGRNGSG